MARRGRRSRSKQRGRGVGSRSQSAGRSKGGSRSSAGRGGNKSGSGAKGGSKGKSTSSKSGRSKGPSSRSSSPARSNRRAPAAPSPKEAPAPKKKPTLTGPGMGPRGKLGPKGQPTKAMQMAKRNIAKYGGTASAAAANRAASKAAAKRRYQTSQANKALAKAGGTSAQVAKDNARYGNTFPSGSIGISEQGKALAAKQRAEAAAKKAAADKAARDRSAAEARRKAAENARRIAAERAAAEAARKAEAERKRKAEEKRQRQFDPNRLLSGVKNAFTGQNLSSGDLRNPLNASNYLAAAGAGYTDAVVGGVNFAKNLIPGLKQLPNVPTLPSYADKNLQNVRNISAVGIPLATGASALKRFASVDPISGKAGFANEIAKMTVSDAAFKAGKVPQLTKTGITNINPGTIAKAFSPQMVATGPTAGATAALSGAMIGGQATTKAGGLNIGSTGGEDSGEATSKTGRTLEARAKRPGFDSLAGAVDFGIGAITGKERTDLDRMGKGLFGQNLVTPRDVVKDAGMVAGKIRDNKLSIGDVKSGYRDIKNIVTSKDRLKTIGDMNTKDLTRLATKGYDVARDSAVVQTAGERLGLPSDFKQQTDTLRDALKDRLSSVKIGDRDSTYKAISDFNRDIGTDPKLSLAARQAEAFRSGEGTTMQKIAAGFQPGAAKAKGLSAAERGIIGSVGNRIISGKQTDIAREAMSGMKAGSSLTAGNLTGIAQNVIKNTAPGADTVSAKRASQIKSIVTGGRGRRDVTPGSLIRGVNPFRGSNRGGGNTPRSIYSINDRAQFQSVGGGTPRSTYSINDRAQIPATGEVPQFQVPEFPTQEGTDAGNLANIQNESYQSTFNKLMAINPNYSTRFQMRRRRRGRRGGFRRAFSRRFFS